jgi:putative phosphoribosyl transferase
MSFAPYMQRIDQAGVLIHGANTTMRGTLNVPDGASGLVIVAETLGLGDAFREEMTQRLAQISFGTLTLAVISPVEASYAPELRFDIEALAQRIIAAIDWAGLWLPHRAHLGLFGTDTAASGALVAASRRANVVDALISVSGRPELAIRGFSRLQAPTLLVVDQEDEPCRHANELAASRLVETTCDLHVLPGINRALCDAGQCDAVFERTTSWLSERVRPQLSQSGVRRLDVPVVLPVADDLSRKRSVR